MDSGGGVFGTRLLTKRTMNGRLVENSRCTRFLPLAVLWTRTRSPPPPEKRNRARPRQVVLVEVGLEAWSCGHASPGAAPQPPLPTSIAGAGSAADERADGGRGRSTSIYDSHEPEQEEPTFV